MSFLRLVSLASLALTGACSPGSDADPMAPPQPTALRSTGVDGADDAATLAALLLRLTFANGR
jgi:hypothetical protein